VVAIQYLLRAEGYDLEADGIFGPITESAVIRFQLAEGLKGDGVFEDETFYALVEKHVLKMGDEGEDVRALQYLLTHRCWSGIAVDGVFGQATYDAVVNVQSIHVFFFHRGVVATETWHAIMRGECDLRMGGSTPR
jgi:peptidoglycan hydrolase-like protein with peptidoglycan-binding domain